MTTEFNPNDPVQTKSGHPARIICTDRNGGANIIALIDFHGREEPHVYRSNGEHNDGNDWLNLMNVAKTHVMYVNVYNHRDRAVLHPTREIADRRATNDRIACSRVTLTEGRFDD